ncbi:MAG: transglutaminase domain-containing protein [Acidobacteria bacterium]|nr:transglutaminase domain-containing protein [Acidobacteriota bacterium]
MKDIATSTKGRSALRARLRGAALVWLFVSIAHLGRASDRWYVVSIADQPVGLLHERSVREGDDLIQIASSQIELNRLGSKVQMVVDAKSVESQKGDFRRADIRMRLSEQETATTAVRQGDALVVAMTVGGKSFERKVDVDGEILGPEGARALNLRSLHAPKDQVRYQLFVGEIGAVSEVVRAVTAVETIEVLGQARLTLKIEEKLTAAPIVSTIWLDEEGYTLQTEQPGPFGIVRSCLATRAEAEAAMSGGELPADIYARTLVRTQIRLPKAREVSWLSLRLTHRQPDLGWPDLERPGQHVSDKTRDSLVLEIQRPRQPDVMSFPVSVTPEDRAYLQANAYLQSDDPVVRETALKVVGDSHDLLDACTRLERWVTENMSFDPGIAMAPSVELFRDRRGTCVGYATLLATLLRAAGIPARVVMGYVYVGGILGGHAWVEAKFGPDWIPFDSAMSAGGVADAARFAILSSSLNGGAGDLSVGPAAQLYGQIDATVLGYAVGGHDRTEVPADARPYQVEKGSYRNPWLGIEWRIPDTFTFADLDRTWSESVVAGASSGDGRTARLSCHQRNFGLELNDDVSKRLAAECRGGAPGSVLIGDRKAQMIDTGPKAVAVVADGIEIWVLTVEGPEAGLWLKRLASGLRM